MTKRYTIRFTNSFGMTTITAISNLIELQNYMQGEAANSIIESRMIFDNPDWFHKAIAVHNKKFLK